MFAHLCRLQNMSCFENATFKICKPIWVVYIVFVFCSILILIALLHCIRTSVDSVQDHIENSSNDDDIPPVLYVRQFEENIKNCQERKQTPQDKIAKLETEHDSDILMQQMEIYKMANYN